MNEFKENFIICGKEDVVIDDFVDIERCSSNPFIMNKIGFH